MGKGLSAAIASIEKRFGEGTVQKMDGKKIKIPVYSSGSKKLDRILGGGFAKGKIIEIYSEEACGKTGRALELVREVQKTGGVVAYIDSEHALSFSYMEQLGVDINKILFIQPSTGEEAFEICREFIKSGEVELIVMDSVSAMAPKAELEGEVGESKMGLHARMMSQGLRLIVGIASSYDCTVCFINQLRDKIGTYTPTKVTSGGNALKFYAFQRLEIKKSLIRDGDKVVGFEQKLKVVKNKMTPPFQETSINIFYEGGSDTLGELVDLAVEFDIIKKAGSWYSYGEVKLGQGVQKVLDLLNDNPELVEEIEKEVKKKL